MKETNSKLVAVILAILAIVIVFLTFFFGRREVDNDLDLKLVNNPSQFFTVNSCLYRFTNYISNKKTSDLMKVLTNKYKKANKVNENNVLDMLPKVTENSTFVSKKMYYKKINEEVTKYYVFGVIRSNVLHDYNIVEKEEEKEVYYIVILDSDKQVFSVEPYDGKVFMDGDSNE